MKGKIKSTMNPSDFSVGTSRTQRPTAFTYIQVSEPEKIPWRRKWQLIPVFLPGELHGQRSLAGYSPGACKRVRHNLAIKEQEPEMVKGTIKGY